MNSAKPGHAVEFQGLRGAAHLNGTKGRLIKFDKKEQRWCVQCDDERYGTVKAKALNLKRISGYDEIPEDPGLRELMNHHMAENAGRPTPSPPPMNTSSKHSNINSLNKAVLDAYYDHRMDGVVVFHGKKYMLAVEFFGPSGNRGASVEMVYVDDDRSAQTLVQQRGYSSAKEAGRNFLLGETTEYIEATSYGVFQSLLDRYKRRIRSKGGLIDVKSGLRLYEGDIE